MDEPDMFVLYIHADPGPRRVIQARFRRMLDGRRPANFDIAFEWPRGDEGVSRLEGWIAQKRASHKNARLVIVIDTVEHVLEKPKGNAYEQAVAAYSPWARLAHGQVGVSLVLVTHTTKASWDDVFDSIQGSTGAQGVVDTIAVFQRQAGKDGLAELCLRGRELAETRVNFRFGSEEGRWLKEDMGDTPMQPSVQRQMAVDAIRHFGQFARRPSAQEIHARMQEHAGYKGTASTVRTLLRRVVDDPNSGVCWERGSGYYMAGSPTPPIDNVDSEDREIRSASTLSTLSAEQQLET
ncbi:MAG: AAA family ATPase [Rhodothermales bacterium]|nr:AAA family ATPase [Rhodothermales bacterium]